jgi:1-acyl-sn-glycerol-3-phosphate acyltransferase
MLMQNMWRIRPLARHPERYSPEKRYAAVQPLVKSVARDLRCRFIVEGLENIPSDTNVLFICNHQSNVDPITLISVIDRPIGFLAKKESEHFIYAGTIIKALGSVFMDRKNFKDEVKAIMAIEKSMRENPTQSFVIFPEGTRSRDPHHEMASFKPGALKAAFSEKKPIVPVALFGSFRCLDKKFDMKRFPVQVHFFRPITPEELEKTSTVELAKRLEEEIKEKVAEMREKDPLLMQEGDIRTKKLPIYFKGM